MTTTAQSEISAGERFAFGKNWRAFLAVLTEQRIEQAENALCEMLQLDSLDGKRFLDIGSGSGLSSLAAWRLGAAVTSFDYDPESVGCTQELRHRFSDNSTRWKVCQGSVLDPLFMNHLGVFDIVYSWGVLHHTGQMDLALEHATRCVDRDGLLLIAIYNDEGAISRFWRNVKQLYCSNRIGRWLVWAMFVPCFAIRTALKWIMFGRGAALSPGARGMSVYYDWIDWLGGYPFEVAKVEELLRFGREHGFDLVNLKTTNRMGCNELVFRRRPAES